MNWPSSSSSAPLWPLSWESIFNSTISTTSANNNVDDDDTVPTIGRGEEREAAASAAAASSSVSVEVVSANIAKDNDNDTDNSSSTSYNDESPAIVVNPEEYLTDRSDDGNNDTTSSKKVLGLQEWAEIVASRLSNNTQEIVSKEQIERVKVMHDRFMRDASFSFNYNTLVLVASIIASLGLVSNSNASIMASMLVSPLMGK